MNNIIVLIVLAAFSGGSVPPFAKVALEAVQPFTLVFIRFLSASLVLLPFVYHQKELSFKAFRELIVVAVIGSLNPILLFIALQFTDTAATPLIYAAGPGLTALYLYSFRKQRIPFEKVLGIAVGFAGVALIILLPFLQNGAMDYKSFGGNMLIFGAAIAFMLYGVYSKDKQQQHQVSPLALTFYFSVTTLLLSIPFSLYEVTSKPVDLAMIQPKHILAGLEIGIIGTSLFYLTYQKAVHQRNELTASLVAYLQPISNILFSVLLLGEKITLPFVIGGTLAVIGAQLASRKSRRIPKKDFGGVGVQIK